MRKIKSVVQKENIGDEYLMGDVIGKGKFSQVIKAVHRETQRTVAVKAIQKE